MSKKSAGYEERRLHELIDCFIKGMRLEATTSVFLTLPNATIYYNAAKKLEDAGLVQIDTSPMGNHAVRSTQKFYDCREKFL